MSKKKKMILYAYSIALILFLSVPQTIGATELYDEKNETIETVSEVSKVENIDEEIKGSESDTSTEPKDEITDESLDKATEELKDEVNDDHVQVDAPLVEDEEFTNEEKNETRTKENQETEEVGDSKSSETNDSEEREPNEPDERTEASEDEEYVEVTVEDKNNEAVDENEDKVIENNEAIDGAKVKESDARILEGEITGEGAADHRAECEVNDNEEHNSEASELEECVTEENKGFEQTESDELVKETSEGETLHTATKFELKNVEDQSEEDSRYQDGDRGDHVQEMKEDLVDLGFVRWSNPTAIYGSNTFRVVEEFQDYYGLQVTGVADEATRDKIAEILNPPYQNGDRGRPVVELKENLVTLGFANWSNPTQFFGSITAGVVEDFQRANNLTINGIAGLNTLNQVEKRLDEIIQNGDRGSHVKELKENLVDLGFAGWSNPTPVYGDITARVVESFQSTFGLNVNGIAGQTTFETMQAALAGELPYVNGDRGQHVKEMKQGLVDLGFVRWSDPTAAYGSNTARVVKEFQDYYGLLATGIADETTRNKIVEVLNPPYQKGDRGEPIVKLKENLVKLGFANWSSPTQFFGSITAGIVKDFQDANNLTVNGIAGSDTLSQIEQLLSQLIQNGDRGSHVKELKENLTKLGFVNWSKPTSVYGDITESIVKDFQRAYGLVPTGVINSKAQELLQKEANNNPVKIFLDPGHGGNDPGGQSRGLNEKDVVLDIARATANVLTNSYTGIEIMLSRTTDTFIELSDRTDMANNWDADYFVSFHTNAFNGSARGFESYIHNSNVSSETKERQKDLHTHLVNKMNMSDRGMKTANFHVLRETSMSAILLEYLFIDNATENALLKQKSYREKLGRVTAEAIAASFNLKR